MKYTSFAALAVIVLVGLAGCRGPQAQGLAGRGADCAGASTGCESCGPAASGELACEDPACAAGHRPCRRHCGPTNPSGPPTGAITYPYYTLHGPRDFLARSPRAIGP